MDRIGKSNITAWTPPNKIIEPIPASKKNKYDGNQPYMDYPMIPYKLGLIYIIGWRP